MTYALARGGNFLPSHTSVLCVGMMDLIMKLYWILLGLVVIGCKQSPRFYTNAFRADIRVQLYDEHKYDFLWCLDNSGSMASRRAFIRDNIQKFIGIMNTRKAVDYQMAVVTTDFFNDGGGLVSDPSGKTVVKSTDSDPVGDFAAIVGNIKGSKTDFWEQCLESVYQAVYQHRGEFSRTGVPLNVIIVSDENDWSCKDDCWGEQPEANTNWKSWPVERYSKYFTNVKASENSEVNIFPIVGLDDEQCAVASLGSRYIDVASAVGGLSVSGSICNSQFKQSYEAIARIIADRGVRFPLDRPSDGRGISVFVDRVLVPYGDDGWVFEPETNSIVFMGRIPSKNSVVVITYSESN